MDGPQSAQLVQDVWFVLFLAILNKATLNISAQDPCGWSSFLPGEKLLGYGVSMCLSVRNCPTVI